MGALEELNKSNSMKRSISRMKSKAVQLKESKSITTKKRVKELETWLYSDEEEEEIEVSFDEWVNLCKPYFTKQNGFECIQLKTIIKHHNTFIRKCKESSIINIVKSHDLSSLNDYYIFAGKKCCDIYRIN